MPLNEDDGKKGGDLTEVTGQLGLGNGHATCEWTGLDVAPMLPTIRIVQEHERTR